MELKDSVALVTGAARGIGSATAHALASEGATVWALDLDPEVNSTVEDIRNGGASAEALVVDIGDSVQVREAVEQIESTGGAVDVLINNAAIHSERSILEMDDKSWNDQLAITLGGTFYCTREVVRGMVRQNFGRIVNISSIAAGRGAALACHYAAAKAGVIGLTKSLARELGPNGITVNAVSPGFVVTPMTEERVAQRSADFLSQIPVGYFAEPQDLVGTILLLSGPRGRYINGQTIHVNGGWYIP